MLVMGNTPSSSSFPSQHLGFFVSDTNHDITAALKRFWEVEQIQAPAPVSPEDAECERYFVKLFVAMRMEFTLSDCRFVIASLQTLHTIV